jgi:hypothetical protein
VKKPITVSPQIRKKTVTRAMNAMLYSPVCQTERSARSGWPAPRFCPTRVAAALHIPQDGMMAKMSTRMAMV